MVCGVAPLPPPSPPTAHEKPALGSPSPLNVNVCIAPLSHQPEKQDDEGHLMRTHPRLSTLDAAIWFSENHILVTLPAKQPMTVELRHGAVDTRLP
jgi:hypothetical protein